MLAENSPAVQKKEKEGRTKKTFLRAEPEKKRSGNSHNGFQTRGKEQILIPREAERKRRGAENLLKRGENITEEKPIGKGREGFSQGFPKSQ